MRAALLLLAVLSFGVSLEAEGGARFTAPSYSIASVVNAASNRTGAIAPNTLVTIYGVNLSYETRALRAEDLIGGRPPVQLPGSGVSVLVGNYPAHILYASPTQVNLLIPGLLREGRTRLQLLRDGQRGPDLDMVLHRAAPALFLMDATMPIVARPDGSLASLESPARRGEIVILYATGLGETEPQTLYGTVPTAAAWLSRIDEFRVLLNGVVVDSGDVLYAGVCPGLVGLYQVNVRLPDDAPVNPELRIGVGNDVSPEGVYLPLTTVD